MPMSTVSEATQQWCADRAHPFITYNPWLDRSYCRCGQRQEAGDQPQDWDAKREIFHHCQPGDPCRCYTGGKPAAEQQPLRTAAHAAQESLFDELDEPTPPRVPVRGRHLRGRPIADVHLPA